MAPSREGARRLLLATFGNGQHGRLGHGTQASELVPRAVAGLAGVVSVACGGAHTACVTADGGLWSWGMNDRGQLGHSGDRAFVAVEFCFSRCLGGEDGGKSGKSATTARSCRFAQRRVVFLLTPHTRPTTKHQIKNNTRSPPR